MTNRLEISIASPNPIFRSGKLGVLLCGTAIALTACLDENSGPTPPATASENAANAATPDATDTESTSSASNGGASSVEEAQGGETSDDPASGGVSTGGTSAQVTSSGGETSDGIETGGSTAGGVATGGVATGGTTTGGTATGGVSTAGAPGAAGAAGAPPTETSLCVTKDGTEYPFDYTYGIMGEYSFEVAMSCDVGGYLLPLVEMDPVDLTAVNAFVGSLSEWFEAAILECPDATTEVSADEFLLVPVSEGRVMSSLDFETIIDVFTMVLSRHDGLDDGFSGEVKEAVLDRLNEYAESAVNDEGSEFTHPVDPESGMCMPSGF